MLAAALAATAWFLRRDRASPHGSADTRARQRRYRRWIGRAWVAFGLFPLTALALLGRLEAGVRLPGEFAVLAAQMPRLAASPPAFLAGLLSGAVAGAIVVGVIHIVRRGIRRGRGPAVPHPIGGVAALLPRNRAELGHAVAMAVTAGIVEELFFRLLLPLLVALVTGSALAGFVASTALFGAVHRYQGPVGVAATTLVGALLAIVYLGSGALWIAMLLHVVLDAAGLVLRPVLAGAWQQAR